MYKFSECHSDYLYTSRQKSQTSNGFSEQLIGLWEQNDTDCQTDNNKDYSNLIQLNDKRTKWVATTFKVDKFKQQAIISVEIADSNA